MDPGATLSQGESFHRAGDLVRAEGAYRAVLRSDPTSAAAWTLLGAVCQSTGRLDEAVSCGREALRYRPEHAAHWNLLGVALGGLGRPADAEACFRRALSLRPDSADVWSDLGKALVLLSRPEEGAACFRKAIAIDPGHGRAHLNLAATAFELDRLDEAEAAARRAAQLEPDNPSAFNNLGLVLQRIGPLREAERAYREGLRVAPGHPELHANLGNAIVLQGRATEAQPHFQRALESRPGDAAAHSNWLLSRQYLPGITAAALAAAHDDWEERHARPFQATWRPFANDPDPDRPLRLGFVSADFRRHPVGSFLVRAIEGLRGLDCRTHGYDTGSARDDLTERFAAAFHTWRPCRGLSDQQLADLVRADQVDLLFDLAGHTSGHRLLVFARKPAPVQLTWAGYAGTTGLSAIDYLVADRHQVLERTEPYYTERIIRLPDGYVCYDPPASAPEVGPLPAFERGHVTFGCFNSPAKVNPGVVAVWAELLHRLPRSRLLLKYKGLDDEEVRARFLERFASHGIEPGRIELEGGSPNAGMLAAYRRVNVALDPFPYSGGVTTCEALWMGVPVITSPGETFAGRHSLSHLAAAGVTGTVARDVGHYVETAAGLATDLPRLAELRAQPAAANGGLPAVRRRPLRAEPPRGPPRCLARVVHGSAALIRYPRASGTIHPFTGFTCCWPFVIRLLDTVRRLGGTGGPDRQAIADSCTVEARTSLEDLIMNEYRSRVAACACALLVAVALLLGSALAADDPARPLHERIDRLVNTDRVGPPVGLSSDGEFLRRVALDLNGVPPSVEEVRAFIADPSADKRARAIDRLLDSPLFARHWATTLDVMLMERRPAQNVAAEEWHSYLMDAARRNRPFNELVAELLRADGGDMKHRAPARFYLDRESDPNAIARDVGRIFFGRDLQCAQCHNHPLVADYRQSDYQGLLAFFSPGAELVKMEGMKKTTFFPEKAASDVAFDSVFVKDDHHLTGPRLPGGTELDEPAFAPGDEYKVKPAGFVMPVPRHSRRAMLADLAAGGRNRAFNENVANRLWAMMMGRGLVHPVDLGHPSNPPSQPELLAMLGREIAALEFDVKPFLRELALTRAYQRAIDLPADVPPLPSSAAAELASLKARSAALEAEVKRAEDAYRKSEKAWYRAEAALIPLAAEHDKAVAKHAEVAKKEEDARAALAAADAAVAAGRDTGRALADAASRGAGSRQEAPQGESAGGRRRRLRRSLRGRREGADGAREGERGKERRPQENRRRTRGRRQVRRGGPGEDPSGPRVRPEGGVARARRQAHAGRRSKQPREPSAAHRRAGSRRAMADDPRTHRGPGARDGEPAARAGIRPAPGRRAGGGRQDPPGGVERGGGGTRVG